MTDKDNQNNRQKVLSSALSKDLAEDTSRAKMSQTVVPNTSTTALTNHDFLNGYYDETSAWANNPSWQKERQVALGLRQTIDKKNKLNIKFIKLFSFFNYKL